MFSVGERAYLQAAACRRILSYTCFVHRTDEYVSLARELTSVVPSMKLIFTKLQLSCEWTITSNWLQEEPTALLDPKLTDSTLEASPGS